MGTQKISARRAGMCTRYAMMSSDVHGLTAQQTGISQSGNVVSYLASAGENSLFTDSYVRLAETL